MSDLAIFYACMLFQGLALVSVPAVSAELTGRYGLSSAQYGATFLPQLAAALAGAFTAGTLAPRVGLWRLLLLSLAMLILAQALLASLPLLPAALAFPTVLAATAALGLGFGFSGAPMNSLPPAFFPSQPHGAVVAAHMLVGSGLALGPLAAGEAAAHAVWFAYPLSLVLTGCALAAGVSLVARWCRPPPHPERNAAPVRPRPVPPQPVRPQPFQKQVAAAPQRSPTFWMFVGIVVLYALAESTFSSWAVIYLRDARGVPELSANLALSSFWVAVVAGRIMAVVLVVRIAPEVLWPALPVMMLAVFLTMPLASDAASGIVLFALAGFACAAVLPLTITLASQCFPKCVPWVASMLIAALMVGIGAGSFAFGILRAHFSFTQLYLLSAIYPALMLLLARPMLRAVAAARQAIGEPSALRTRPPAGVAGSDA